MIWQNGGTDVQHSPASPPGGGPERLARSEQARAGAVLAVALLSSLITGAALLWPLVPRLTIEPQADYRGTGVIVEILPPPSGLHPTRPVIIIHHDPLSGLMEEAMAMPFLAASTQLFGNLRPGDRIAFGLKETPDALLVVLLERLNR
ncbi:MAG: copper-binding protein, partial [candidate division NC10 bacterium]|nr:copper-binding protein [candidate division NC10 bacterium]